MIEQKFFHLVFNKDLYDKIKVEAKNENRSVNNYIKTAVLEKMKREGKM